MDPGRRPDRVGVAFGVFVILAALAVLVRVALPGGGPDAGTGFRRFLPSFVGGDDATALDEPLGIGLGAPGPRVGGPLSPLYYEGPRELEAAGPREPEELVVPRIGVRTRLLRLDKRADGRMEVPGDFSLAGWYVRGPAPGAPGPAIIAGHRDSRRGAAVFARLGDLERGDEIVVRRGDGREVRFTVTRAERYSKAAFPTQKVYGNTAGPELRLITCDGDFDHRARSYDENLVVFATASPGQDLPDDQESFAPVPEDSGTPSAAPTPEPSPAAKPSATPSPTSTPTPTPTSTAAPSDTPIRLP